MFVFQAYVFLNIKCVLFIANIILYLKCIFLTTIKVFLVNIFSLLLNSFPYAENHSVTVVKLLILLRSKLVLT